ncbi:MAG: hypothetical protein A3G24_26625 [Betaproteobacteria bacterium RIFCSPLOWO2_12_FULL_62_13]|nr:MAG: hypothetical protein A3G24_26625 [Betaproteobacteria bacterium RIFCSPLOWO2_12_FULL_62_13]
MDHKHDPDSGNQTKSRGKWALIGFVAIAAYFLIAEHRAHLSELLYYLPYLLLLACPLLHLFMHGGHGGHGDHGGRDAGKSEKKGE